MHPDILITDVWITIGFTYNHNEQKYYLVKEKFGDGQCLACAQHLVSHITAFCFRCKASRPLDWTTANNSLDLLIMKSWNNTKHQADAYIQWIEYSYLTNIRETTLLHHECTHMADWLEPATNKRVTVILKTIVDGQNSQSFDFHQVNVPTL